MRVVHFGAGAIGRGFIAERLAASGHDITLIDTNAAMMRAIDEARRFDLYWINQDMRREQIGPFRALATSDADAVLSALVEADLVTTAVWATNLRHLAPCIVAALEARASAGRPALQLIPCENAVDNGEILASAVLEELDGRDRAWLEEHARFASTVVDRMVFDAPGREGVAPVEAGDSFELVIDRPGLIDRELTPIAGAHVADSLTPFLERKLFLINGGHARAAYLGALRGYTNMQEVYADHELMAIVRASMSQVAALVAHDHGFPRDEIESYVDFALDRWVSSGMPDEITRVGRSPIRKLSPEDRLVAPALRARDLGLPHDLILEGIAAALLYRDPDDPEAVQLGEYVETRGLADALDHFTGIDPASAAGQEVLEQVERLRPTTHHTHQE